MKEFNLGTYNRLVAEGKTPKVVTRGGMSARIICTDKKGNFPVVAAILESDNVENLRVYIDNGVYSDLEGLKSPYDLFFADTEPTYRPYKSREEVMKDLFKHCGWVKDKATGNYSYIITVRRNREGRLIIGTECFDIEPDRLLKNYAWYMDDDPCGVKEE